MSQKPTSSETPVLLQNSPQTPAASFSFQSYSSPWPLPIVLEACEKVAPGSAREILNASIKALEANTEIQKLSVHAAIAHDRRVFWIALIILVPSIPGAFVIAFLNKDVYSYGLCFGGLAALIGAFWYSQKHRKH